MLQKSYKRIKGESIKENMKRLKTLTLMILALFYICPFTTSINEFTSMNSKFMISPGLLTGVSNKIQLIDSVSILLPYSEVNNGVSVANSNLPKIHYGGGPLMLKMNLYNVFYGTFTNNQKNLIKDFILDLGESSWWKISRILLQVSFL